MKQILQGARDLGPYLLVELLLPGGSLIALAMWLARRRDKKGKDHARTPVGADDAGLCRGCCA
jgi:hypothetical protein